MQEALRNCSRQNIEKTECLLMSGSLGSVFNNLSDSQENSEWLFKNLFPDLQCSFLQCCITCKGSITTLGHQEAFPWHSNKEVKGTRSQGWWVVVRDPGGACKWNTACNMMIPPAVYSSTSGLARHWQWEWKIPKRHASCQIHDKNQEEDLTKKDDRF